MKIKKPFVFGTEFQLLNDMKLFQPFIERKPWAAALLSVVLSAPIAMLYLNRGWLALGYFLLLIAVLAAPFAAFQHGLITVSPYEALDILNLIYVALGALHAFIIARRFDREKPLRWYARWRGIFAVFVFPILLALMVRTFLFEPFNLPSISMEPNLPVGSYIFASKSAYGYPVPFTDIKLSPKSPDRGDVVIFWLDSGYGRPFSLIKRVIGMPGEQIQIKDGLVFINGEALKREKIDGESYSGDDVVYIRYRETLPNGRSYDILEQTDNNLLDNTDVFLVPEGHYFLMGDNRDNSRDSRVLDELGYISESQIYAKVVVLFWDRQSQGFSYTPIP